MSEEDVCPPAEEDGAENKIEILVENEAPSTAAGNEIAQITDVNSKTQNVETKVELILKPVGDAPIMKQKKWSLPGSRTIGWVNAFIRKYLKLPVDETLFLYINQSFAPMPDHSVQTLFDCFGSDGKLVIHYSRTQAWG